MYVLITYDVEAQRTKFYRRVLARYLVHEQNSVFGGDLTEAKLVKLHRDLAKIASTGDRIFQVKAENRNNVSVALLKKAEGNSVLERVDHDHHRKEAIVI
jgi:CRISPR-associated protein Cas2